MSIVSPPLTSLACPFEIPPLAGQAWLQLVQTLSPLKSARPTKTAHSDSATPPFTDGVLPAWQALPIATLSGWEIVAAWPEDDWVLHYEQLQATLAKKQRKTGQRQDGVFYTSSAVARYLTGFALFASLLSGNGPV